MNKNIGKFLVYAMFIAVIVATVVGILSATNEPDPTIMDVIDYFEDGKIVECEYNVYLESLFIKTVDKKEYTLRGITYFFFKEEIYDVFIKGNADAVVPETGT